MELLHLYVGKEQVLPTVNALESRCKAKKQNSCGAVGFVQVLKL